MNAITQKKEQIILSAIDLFADQGISVSTAEIAKTAEVANGTLFYNFDTKQDLIESVYLYIKRETFYAVSRGIEEDMLFKDKLYTIWENYIEWALQNKSQHKVLSMLKNSQVLSADVMEKSELIYADLFDMIKSAKRQHQLKEMPFQLLCNIAFAQLDALFEYVTTENLTNCKLKEITDISFNIFLTGVRA